MLSPLPDGGYVWESPDITASHMQAQRYTLLSIQLTTDVEATGEVRWRRAGETYDTGGSQAFLVVPGAHIYEIDLAAHEAWSGEVGQVRVEVHAAAPGANIRSDAIDIVSPGWPQVLKAHVANAAREWGFAPFVVGFLLLLLPALAALLFLRLTPSSGAPFVLASVSVLMVAGALRLLFLDRESLWLDEIFRLYTVAGLGPLEVIKKTFSWDVHPPAFYLLLQQWVGLTGESASAMRALAVAGGLLNVVLMAPLARSAGLGRAWSLVAMLLVAFSPLAVYQSQEAQMYVWLMAGFAGMLLFLCRILRDGVNWSSAAGLLACWIFFAYAHGASGFVFLPFLLVALAIRASGLPVSEWRRRAALGGAVIVIYLPWMARLVALQATPREMSPFGLSQASNLATALVVHHTFPLGYWGIGISGVALASGIYAAIVGRRIVVSALFLAAYFLPQVTIALLCLWKPFYKQALAAPLLVPWGMLVVLGLETLWTPWQGTTRRQVTLGVRAAIGAGVAAMLGLMTMVSLAELVQRSKYDWRAAAAYMDAAMAKDAIAVHYPGWTWIATDYYLRQRHGQPLEDVPKMPENFVYMNEADDDFAGQLGKVRGLPKGTEVFLVMSHIGNRQRVVDALMAQGAKPAGTWQGVQLEIPRFVR